MKTINLKNTLRVAGILSLMGTTLAMDGPSKDFVNIPTGNVRSRPSIGNLQSLIFENGQFTATINGKTRVVENHEVSKDLKTLIAINKLEEYINADGKLSIGKPGNAYIDLNGELLGGVSGDSDDGRYTVAGQEALNDPALIQRGLPAAVNGLIPQGRTPASWIGSQMRNAWNMGLADCVIGGIPITLANYNPHNHTPRH